MNDNTGPRATPAPDAAVREAAERVQRRVGEWDSLGGFSSGDSFAATGEQLRHDAMALVVAALAQQPQAVPDGWRTIDSAPKDGTEFQGWVSWGGRDGCWEPKCRFNADTEAFEVWGRVDYDQDGWDSHAFTVSYWIPTPAAPVSGRAGK